MDVNFFSAFGFHTESSAREIGMTQKNIASKINLTRIIAYVPIAGTVIAILRINSLRKKVISESSDSVSFRAAIITRAFFEGIGAGILLLIPDMIVSIGRLVSGSYSGSSTHITAVLKKLDR